MKKIDDVFFSLSSLLSDVFLIIVYKNYGTCNCKLHFKVIETVGLFKTSRARKMILKLDLVLSGGVKKVIESNHLAKLVWLEPPTPL